MMLVRRIELRNIRSYRSGSLASVELPEGVVLLEGDIGSGKSTLLLALEFALFGFSDTKGEHLLTEGREEGDVRVAFDVGRVTYTVERKLRRKGEDVVQSECLIWTDGVREKLSPSELKERVISILGFNEPTHPLAESLVYRYAVFTPQEQMKEILTQKADDRLYVIRRVLGVQSYQAAAENSSLLETRLGRMSYGLKKASADLEEGRREFKERSELQAELDSRVRRLQSGEEDAVTKVAGLDAESRVLVEKRQALGMAMGGVPTLRRSVLELERLLKDHRASVARLEERLKSEINPATSAFDPGQRPTSSLQELELGLRRERGELATLSARRGALEIQLERDGKLISNGVCPVCRQKLSEDFSADVEHMKEEAGVVDSDIKAASGRVASAEELVDNARRFFEDERDHERAVKRKTEAEADIATTRTRIRESEERLTTLKSELAALIPRESELVGLSQEIKALEDRLGAARKEKERISIELGEARTKRNETAERLARLSAELERKDREAKEALRLGGYETWLSDFFRPTVELVEKQTMARAMARFNEHFQRFFASLVDDPEVLVRVREDFSPVFEREGFSQDYEALSGGERTSMALAYRFALNSVVSEDLSVRPELIILDEPTDGFSKEELNKMRGLMEKLNAVQVIIVSHERELESMAEHLIRVEKVNGSSTLTAVGRPNKISR